MTPFFPPFDDDDPPLHARFWRRNIFVVDSNFLLTAINDHIVYVVGRVVKQLVLHQIFPNEHIPSNIQGNACGYKNVLGDLKFKAIRPYSTRCLFDFADTKLQPIIILVLPKKSRWKRSPNGNSTSTLFNVCLVWTEIRLNVKGDFSEECFRIWTPRIEDSKNGQMLSWYFRVYANSPIIIAS